MILMSFFKSLITVLNIELSLRLKKIGISIDVIPTSTLTARHLVASGFYWL